MASETADENGYVTSQTLKHYQRLGMSGVGLAIAEYTFVHPFGKSEPNQLGVYSDSHLEGLVQLVKTIKKGLPDDPVLLLQLAHSGGKSDSQLTEGNLMGPSGISVPVKDKVLEAPRPMTEADIELWKQSFWDAARRAQEAGFDGVELHAAHGYGLSQFLSPITNQRQDVYGKDLLGRARLICEIIQGIRAQFPTLLVSVRMPGQDFLEGGLTPHDCALLARSFEEAGADILSISSGIGGWRRPVERTGEGYLVDEAGLLKEFVRIPIIGVGGIESAEYIDESLLNHKASLFAVGRKILTDPALFRAQVLERKE
jgi:NADPH2 dehydrogenase